MTGPDDGSWDDATQHDDSAQMDGDDQPTIRANDEHVAALRRERMKQRLVDEAASTQRRRTTNQGLQDKTRTPAQGMPVPASADREIPLPAPPITNRGIPVQPDPASTNRGIPVAPAYPSAPDIASALHTAAGDSPPPIAKARIATEDGVILLDRVSANAPVGDTPRRSESASGGVVIVATGGDAERVRKLCHAHSLLVPVMSSIAIAHEALCVVVIGEPSPPAPERVVHVVRPDLPDAKLVELLRALVTGYTVAEPPSASEAIDEELVAIAQRIAKLTDRAEIEQVAAGAITSVLGADRASCLFFDPSTGALWSESARRMLGDSRRAIAGFVGWAAYTGEPIHAEPAGDDVRYFQELDDPQGKPQSRLIVQPIIGGDRRTHAVLVAARRWRNNPFDHSDVVRIARLAALLAPTFDVAVSKPRTKTLQGAANNAHTAALIDPARTRPPTAPPRPRPPSAPPHGRPPTSPPQRSSQALLDAPTAPRAPITTDDSDASESKRLRATKQPPSTSTTGRTRVPTGDTRPGTPTPPSASPVLDKLPLPPPRHPPSTPPTPAAMIPMLHRVAIVATDDEHDRARRIAKTIGLDIALASTTDSAPADARLVTLGLPWSPELDPRVIYVARATISNDHLADLLTAIANGKTLASADSVGKPGNPNEARKAQIAFTGSRAFAAALDFVTAEASAIATLRELLDADRAYFLLYDDASGALSSASRKLSQGDNRRSIAGMAGWVALTGRAAHAERAASDPRWLGPIDDPDGDSNSQLMMQPVLRADRRVQAIIVAAKRPRRPGFTDLDVMLAERFASLVSPLLEQLEQHVETQKLVGDTPRTNRSPEPVSPLGRLLGRIKNLFGR